MAKTNQALAAKIADKKGPATPEVMTGTGPTTQAAPPPKTLEFALDARSNQFREALSGSGMSWDRFKRILVTEVAGNPDLKYAASVNPMSLLSSAFEIASLGLDPSIPNEVFLVARNVRADSKNPPEVTMMTGYKGLSKLAMESARDSHVPLVTLRADIIYENDQYHREFGDKPFVSHSPPPFGHDRGKVLGYVAVARDASGKVNFREMTVSQVQVHKERFSKAKYGPFADPANFDAYGLKTVMRSLINKDLPMGPKLARAASIDSEGDDTDMPRSTMPMVIPEVDPQPTPRPTPEPEPETIEAKTETESPKAETKAQHVVTHDEAHPHEEEEQPPHPAEIAEKTSAPKKDSSAPENAKVEQPKQTSLMKASSVVASVASKTGMTKFQEIQERARLMREKQLAESTNGKAGTDPGNDEVQA